MDPSECEGGDDATSYSQDYASDGEAKELENNLNRNKLISLDYI